jgi:ribonuclease HI
MEQLCIFESDVHEGMSKWKLYLDGASRNNPGPAGAGIVLYKNNELVQEGGYYLGLKTNNQAEYMALLIGLFEVKKIMKPNDQLLIISDSQLMVRQLQGMYKVKNPELKKCFSLAKYLLKDVPCNIKHVLRHENKQADAMANRGVDTKNEVPEAFVQLLKKHAIAW